MLDSSIWLFTLGFIYGSVWAPCMMSTFALAIYAANKNNKNVLKLQGDGNFILKIVIYVVLFLIAGVLLSLLVTHIIDVILVKFGFQVDVPRRRSCNGCKSSFPFVHNTGVLLGMALSGYMLFSIIKKIVGNSKD